ncbi:MAG: thioesterase family protein [Rhodospirillales bacterium]|nr:thioesterase family protein [Rhodospirillales bacterium]
MADRTFETLRAVVYPAQCDAMGHLSVKEYMGFFDQAEWHCFLALGFDPAWIETEKIGWADVHHAIEYKSELLAGALVRAESSVVKVGNKSLTTLHHLYDAANGKLCASLEAVSVQYDLKQRQSVPLHDQVRRTAREKLNDGF